MPNTYTDIHLHLIFAVKFRDGLISKKWKEELHKYITAIIQKEGHKMIQINSMPDHVHCLIGMRPVQSLSNLMQQVKSNSSGWINERRLTSGKFEWQGGYAAFSCSRSHLPKVIAYIQNQEVHHAKKSFREEYLEFLELHEVEFDQRYIFEELQ